MPKSILIDAEYLELPQPLFERDMELLQWCPFSHLFFIKHFLNTINMTPLMD